MLPPVFLGTVRGAPSPATDRALPSRALFSPYINRRKGNGAGLRVNPVKAATACRQTPTSQRALEVLNSARLPVQKSAPATNPAVLSSPPPPAPRIVGTPHCLPP